VVIEFSRLLWFQLLEAAVVDRVGSRELEILPI
jgi:hypothetical protein